MSKKGIFGSLLVDPWFIIAFIFILIIFYILFSLTVTKETEEIKGEFVDLDSSLVFINFLRLPVGNNLNILDLFSLYSRDNKEETAKKIRENGKNFFISNSCFEVYIEDKKMEKGYFGDCDPDYLGEEVDNFIFTNFDEKQMKIALFKWNQEDETCDYLNSKEECESWLGCKWENGCKEI
ncbi:MAG: hypothetical protein AABX29_01995 [Nanoarchaeota archaeon]